MPALLDISDLHTCFRTPAGILTAVNGVSLSIDRGTTLALVGESGSGKSVTALSILQLLPYPRARHPRGSIRLDGVELVGAPERTLRAVRGARIAMVFQEPMTSLNPLHSIAKQVGEVIEIHEGLRGAPLRARVLDLLAMVGIPEAAKRLIRRVTDDPLDESLRDWTAEQIADIRASDEGQEGVAAFLDKCKPSWVEV